MVATQDQKPLLSCFVVAEAAGLGLVSFSLEMGTSVGDNCADVGSGELRGGEGVVGVVP